jgi:hypothetical protein
VLPDDAAPEKSPRTPTVMVLPPPELPLELPLVLPAGAVVPLELDLDDELHAPKISKAALAAAMALAFVNVTCPPGPVSGPANYDIRKRPEGVKSLT